MRITCIVFSIVTFFVQTLNAQISIVENTKNRFSFEWKIDNVDTISIKNGNSWSTRASFTGQTTTLGKFTNPLLPGYSFILGIPQNGPVNVIIQPEIVVALNLNHPLQIQNDSSMHTEYQYQSGWISDPQYKQFGSMRTAQFFLRPIFYNMITGDCKVMLRGKVIIDFPPSNDQKIMSNESYFSKMLKTLVLNYSVAENWKTGHLGKRAVENYPLSSSQKMVFFQIGDGHAGNNEGTTNENGIVKIPGNKIREVFGRDFPIRQLSLYASNKGALDIAVPPVGSIPDGISEIPLYRYDENKNGIVDSEDYFLAYVTGSSEWVYKNEFNYRIDDYDDYRTYWLTNKTSGGLTMGKFVQPDGDGDTVDHFTNHFFYKTSSDHQTGVEGGIWVSKKLTNSDRTFNYTFDLPFLDTNFAGNVNVTNVLYGEGCSIVLSIADLVLNDNHTINHWGNKKFKIAFEPKIDTCISQIVSIQVDYKSKISGGMDTVKIPIFSSSDNGIVHYKLDNLRNEKIYLFRISQDEGKISLIDTIRGGLSSSYVWADSGNKGAMYYACNESAFLPLPVLKSPENVQKKYVYNDLRSGLHTTDYLIIVPTDFIDKAVELAIHKEKIGFKNPGIVDINEIYRSFSGGNKDPTAIRNFLAYVKNNWTNGNELFYVVLMGYGHNNPKNFNNEKVTDFIPIYQHGNELYEDYYTYTLPGSTPQLVIGRFPCKTLSDVDAIIQKVIEMEDPDKADFGPWRNRALFVADDDMQGKESDGIGNGHCIASENVSRKIESLCPSLDLRKAYLFNYPWNSELEKPEVNRAIVNAINNGVAYINYFGHGGWDVWADEHVLTKNNISSMNNKKQYPLVLSFSCSVGMFDNAGEECLSASLVNAPLAGACVTLSSTRKSDAGSNEDLANDFYTSLLDSSNIVSVGTAYFLANVHSNTTNGHHTYAIFGDPSIRFVRPERNISFQIQSITDNKITDTISALQQIKIKGTIIKSDSSVDTQFGNGTVPAFVNIGLYNAPDSTSRKDGGKDGPRYVLPGTPVFIGKTAVINGVFEQAMIISRKLSFDKAGVKLSGYAWKEKENTAGVGFKKDLVFHGSVTSTSNDTIGPQISIRPVYDNASLGSATASFADEITASLPCKFAIDVFDESGIDVSGAGPDEGLTIEIPGVFSTRAINSKFQFKSGDFRQGSAAMELDKTTMKPGTYTLNISAQDIIGNISKKTFSLEITHESELTLDHVFNFPNPFRMGRQTRFFFFPSNTSINQIFLTIKIYSLSGRLLRVFTNASNGEVWDGRDQVGTMLSPNIYLYQVTGYNASDKKTTKSPIKKVVLQPPY